jgi:hypothetical protein
MCFAEDKKIMILELINFMRSILKLVEVAFKRWIKSTEKLKTEIGRSVNVILLLRSLSHKSSKPMK